jgi:hypothetical protein
MTGVKGTLRLDDRALVFEPTGGRASETVLPMSSILRVHRPPGTPVLEVSVDLPNAPSVIGFYFVEPPPLAQAGSALRLIDKFVAKRRAVIKLKVASSTKRDEVDRWVMAIKSAKTEA